MTEIGTRRRNGYVSELMGLRLDQLKVLRLHQCEVLMEYLGGVL